MFKKLLLIPFGFAVAALALALTEGALALLHIGDDLRFDDPFVGFAEGSDLFVRDQDAAGRPIFTTKASKLEFFNPQSFAATKPPGSYRVFTLGGSTTAGRPYDDKVAFGRWLQLYLDAAEPDRVHEVINAGAISYASYRIALLMKEIVRYQPDLLVVYTGHNEFLEERSYTALIDQPRWWQRLRLWLGGRRFFALARSGLRSLRPASPEAGTQLAGEVETKLEGWTGLERYQRDDRLAQSITQHFAANLRRMAALARAHDVRLLFVEPVANLKDFSPFKSQHTDGLTAAQIARVDSLLAEAVQQLQAGDSAVALDRLDAALAIDPLYAELHFRAGRAHLALGDTAAARAAFVRAKDLDVAPLRATEPILRILRETVADEGLTLIDLPALLAAESRERFGHSLLGNEYLLDHVHPNFDVHARIAGQIVEELAAQGEVRIAAGWSATTRRAIRRQVVASLDEAYYAQRDLNLATVLGWAGKIEEARAPLLRVAHALPNNSQAHLHLGIVHQRLGEFQAAAEELRLAIQLTPDSAAAHFNLGIVLGRMNRLDTAIAELEAALDRQPDYPEALHNLGVLLRRQGNLTAAVAAFRRALDLQPDASESQVGLGIALRRQGNLDAAAQAFEKALIQAPDDADTLTELGITRARLGQTEQARHQFDRALALDPAHTEALYNRGLLAARTGDRSRAAADYRATLAAAPDHARAANNLAILLAGQGDRDGAKALLQQAIENDPTYADAQFNLGILHDANGQPQAAIQAIERALELAPNTPRYHQALAALYQATGQPKKARKHLEALR